MVYGKHGNFFILKVMLMVVYTALVSIATHPGLAVVVAAPLRTYTMELAMVTMVIMWITREIVTKVKSSSAYRELRTAAIRMLCMLDQMDTMIHNHCMMILDIISEKGCQF